MLELNNGIELPILLFLPFYMTLPYLTLAIQIRYINKPFVLKLCVGFHIGPCETIIFLTVLVMLLIDVMLHKETGGDVSMGNNTVCGLDVSH